MRILVVSLFCVCAFSLKAQKVAELSNNKPNIIFILTDDQRFDAIGYAGNKLISTPEMDKLAEDGTFFKNAMVTTPICAAVEQVFCPDYMSVRIAITFKREILGVAI